MVGSWKQWGYEGRGRARDDVYTEWLAGGQGTEIVGRNDWLYSKQN
jgi:hypothetical protein